MEETQLAVALKGRMDSIDTQIAALSSKVEQLAAAMAEERVLMGRMVDSVGNLTAVVTNLNGVVVQGGSNPALTQQVALVVSRLDEKKRRLERVEADIDELKQIKASRVQVDHLQADVEALKDYKTRAVTTVAVLTAVASVIGSILGSIFF